MINILFDIRKRAFYLLLVVAVLTLSFPITAQVKAKVSGIDVGFPKAVEDRFRITIDSNGLGIGILGYQVMEDQPIEFSVAPEKLEIKYKLGFLQYTTDDSPAQPIIFVKWTNSFLPKAHILPSFYNNLNEVDQAHKLLGFSSRQTLAETVFKQNQYTITQQSLHDQEQMYSRVLNDTAIGECCPEYIKLANESMTADKSTLNSIDKLHIEFVYLPTMIRASFDINGEKKEVKIIIAKAPF